MNRIIATVCRKQATVGKDGRSDYGSNGASFTVELDVTDEMVDNPQYLLERGRAAYALAEAMVAEQLVRSTPRPKIAPMTQAELDAPEAVNPAVARATQPPPSLPLDPRHAAPAPLPAPPPNNGRTKEGPPENARQLAGWAKKHGLIKWFSDLGRRQNPPLSGLLSEWSDEWAVWAYQTWLASQPAPALPSNGNGNGHPY